ncbi:MAG: metallophosphoesterase [Acutalibacteraceae bacterium]|nr:metallophosphoesterase [Acutalibacteraceae bacterium]
MKKRFKIFKLVILTILSFIIIITAYIIANQYVITTSKYSIESDRVKNDIKIAVISDLHGRDFGNDNNIIVNKISKEKPDLIAVIGDMIDEYTENDEAVLNTLKPLPEIAPTYYSIGNHDYLYSDYDNYIKTLESSGVVILNDETTKLTVGENKLTLLGLSNYSFGEVENPMYTELMKELCENDDLRIMLCHYPEFTPWFFGQDLYYESDFELMLSGHTHGGLVRLPFFGGLYAPNQGLFPEYSKGLYYIDKENKNPYHMLVTGGLGPDTRFIRINNFPEISFITVKPVK